MSRWDALRTAPDRSTRNTISSLPVSNRRWKREDNYGTTLSSGHAVGHTAPRGQGHTHRKSVRNGVDRRAGSRSGSLEMASNREHTRECSDTIRFDDSIRKLRRQLDRYGRRREENVDVWNTHPGIGLKGAVRCSVLEFYNVLSREAVGGTFGSSDPNIRDEESSAEFISPNAKGSAIAVLFGCVDWLDCFKEEDAKEAARETSDFVARLETIHGADQEKASFVMNDSDVSLSLKVLSRHLGQLLSLIDWENIVGLASEDEESILTDMLLHLRCLACLLWNCGYQMKAEDTAENVVRSILLPILETSERVDALKQPQISKCWEVSMDCIDCLVRMKRHASAFLAPLVVEVTEAGEERHAANPLRSRITQSLQQILLHENNPALLSQVCPCISSVLRAISSIEKNSQARTRTRDGAKVNTPDFDVVSVARRIQCLIKQHRDNHFYDQSIIVKALGLLATLAQTHPLDTAAQWSLFLQEHFEATSSDRQLRTNRRTSQLLSLIHSGADSTLVSDKVRVAAITATKELILAMPLRLWFSPKTRQSAWRSCNESGNLVSHVGDPVVHIMEAACCTLRNFMHESDEVVIALFSLTSAACATVPADIDARFVQHTTRVISVIAGLFVEYTKAEVKPNSKVLCAAAKTLANCVGGKLTQQGTLTELPRPTREWLVRNSNGFFLQAFAVISSDSCYATNVVLVHEISDSCAQILRMAPWVLTNEPIVMERFERAVHDAVKSYDAQLRNEGAKLVEKYLHGRREFCTKKEEDFSLVVGSLCPLLFGLFSDSEPSVRSTAAAACGHLVLTDWASLLESNERDLFRWLLHLCLGPREEPASDVRSEACKSIGSMCTACLEPIKPEAGPAAIPEVRVRMICQNVADAMLTAIKDPNASVRCMALFAIGNLALSLKERGSEKPMISVNAFINLSLSVRDCLEDNNEKVVGNAIRTIGHLLYQSSCYQCLSETEHCHNNICEKLTDKIRAAVEDATKTSSKLSWKQRSHAKKHAKNAATSLSYFLCCCDETTDYKSVEIALTQLIACIENAYVLDCKIVTAAVRTLKDVPISAWRKFRGECTVLGYAIASSVIVLFEEKRGNRKLPAKTAEDLCSLLSALLLLATVSDICQSFSIEEVTSDAVDFLYKWMVNRDAESQSFKIVFVALQSQNLKNKFDVSMEQKFLSRAIHVQKREQSPSKLGTGEGKTRHCSVSEGEAGKKEEDEL